MGDLLGLIIFVFIVSRIVKMSKSKTKNTSKKATAPPGQTAENSGYPPYKKLEDAYDSAKNTIKQRMAKPSQKATANTPVSTPSEQVTEIEKRRKQQHDSHMDKRIHRNVHADNARWEEDVVVNEMKTIRDLIVCGYSTELPNQRDFIKEGEDFLARLSSDSLFF